MERSVSSDCGNVSSAIAKRSKNSPRRSYSNHGANWMKFSKPRCFTYAIASAVFPCGVSDGFGCVVNVSEIFGSDWRAMAIASIAAIGSYQS